MRTLALLLLALLACPALAAPPRSITATYQLNKGGQQIGVMSETFRQTDDRYQLESVTTATGVYALFAKGKIRLLSSGDVTPAGLRPSHFEHHRGADAKKNILADFNWDKHTLTLAYDGKSENAELKPGTQDRISLLYQFAFQPPRGEEIALHMTTGRHLNLYRYKVVGNETLTTPAGRFETVHLVKLREGDEDGTEIWLAKERHYFPVRIVIEEHKGARMEQEITRLDAKD